MANYLCCKGCGDDVEDSGTGTRYLLALWVCYYYREGSAGYP